MRSRKMLGVYFNSWWLPAVAFLVLFGGFAVTALSNWKPAVIASNALLVVACVALLGVLAACVWNLTNKRWATGVTNLLPLPICGMAAVYAFGVSNATFTIYEGDWGKPYAARFEVLFAPDSGTAERKLMEKVFKIEGWQR